MLTGILRRGGTGGRGTAPIARSHRFVEGAFIKMLYTLFNGAILNDHKAPGLAVAPIGRTYPGLEDLVDQFVRYRVRFQAAHSPRSVDNVEQVSTFCHSVLL